MREKWWELEKMLELEAGGKRDTVTAWWRCPSRHQTLEDAVREFVEEDAKWEPGGAAEVFLTEDGGEPVLCAKTRTDALGRPDKRGEAVLWSWAKPKLVERDSMTRADFEAVRGKFGCF